MPKKIDGRVATRIAESKGFTPISKYPGANKAWKSKCKKCKKVTSPTFTSIKKGIGCKYCGHRAVDPKDAVLAMKKRGFKTLEVFPGATKDWLVRCIKCKKKYQTVFHSLTTKNGCKYCAGVVVEESDLFKRLAVLKLKPLEKYQSAKIPWKCRCLVCDKIVQPTWDRIKQGRGHCAYCAQRRVDIPMALKYMTSVNLKPLRDFPGSNKPWRCECLVCKAEVTPRWSDLQRGQGGCSNCADYGLNYQKSGYIYLITNSKFKAHKIGIANSYKSSKFDDRMYQHKKRGWMLYKKINFKTVKEASDIETSTLKWLRLDVGLPFVLNSKQMPQGGHTETVDASEIDLPTLWAKVEELSKKRKKITKN